MTRWPLGRACAALACLLSLAGIESAARGGGATVHPFVQKLFSQKAVQVVSYRALRRLEAENRRFNKSGWIQAVTELDTAHAFHYTIVAKGGSEYVHRKALVPILEGEQKAWSDGESERAALSVENYTFGEPADSPDGFVRLPIAPLRREGLLVSGQLVLTSDADLVSVEGRLVKNPSFWTRRVDVVRRYARINGVRVPVETSSTAQVFMAGTSTFSMCYDYEAINGEPVASRSSCS